VKRGESACRTFLTTRYPGVSLRTGALIRAKCFQINHAGYDPTLGHQRFPAASIWSPAEKDQELRHSRLPKRLAWLPFMSTRRKIMLEM
jgi:hypothetical protein